MCRDCGRSRELKTRACPVALQIPDPSWHSNQSIERLETPPRDAFRPRDKRRNAETLEILPLDAAPDQPCPRSESCTPARCVSRRGEPTRKETGHHTSSRRNATRERAERGGPQQKGCASRLTNTCEKRARRNVYTHVRGARASPAAVTIFLVRKNAPIVLCCLRGATGVPKNTPNQSGTRNTLPAVVQALDEACVAVFFFRARDRRASFRGRRG